MHLMKYIYILDLLINFASIMLLKSPVFLNILGTNILVFFFLTYYSRSRSMAENTVATPAGTGALQDPESNAKNVTSCCIISNNNDGISGIEQDVPMKSHHSSQRSENHEKKNMHCNGKPYSQHSTKVASSESDAQEKALLDTPSEGKKLNGLIHNESNINDKSFVKNIISVVSEDRESASNDDSKHIQKTNLTPQFYPNCDVSSRDSEVHCIPSESNSTDIEADALSKKFEDVSVVTSWNTILSSDCNNQSASESKRNFDEHGIEYVVYESEKQMPDIMRLITKDLSEPYSIYTYRYFIHNWPKLCFLVSYFYCNYVKK